MAFDFAGPSEAKPRPLFRAPKVTKEGEAPESPGMGGATVLQRCALVGAGVKYTIGYSKLIQDVSLEQDTVNACYGGKSQDTLSDAGASELFQSSLVR